MSRADPFATATRARIELPDLNGHLRGKWLPPRKLAGAKPIGLSDVVYCLTCADEVFENPEFASSDSGWPDVVAVPDLSTAATVPAEPGTVAVLCDAVRIGPGPPAFDQRGAVRTAAERLQALGLTAECGVEYELFLFRDDEAGRRALREGRHRDLHPVGEEQQAYSLLRSPELRGIVDDLFTSLEPYGVPLDSVLTELGHGMIEVAIAPLDPLGAADAAARLKLAVNELARRHGMVATFIAKWDMAQSGCSGHIHCSLLRDGENALAEGRGTLTELGNRALAGLCARAAELSVFMAPNVNSYRRYRPETWTPLTVGWGHDNRNAAVRVITTSAEATRFELRRPGADLNPYLCIAACLHACADGIERSLAPPPEAPGRSWAAVGAEPFPATLLEATAALEESAPARAAFGDRLVDHYAISRRAEHACYAAATGEEPDLELAQVPPAEIGRYFNVA